MNESPNPYAPPKADLGRSSDTEVRTGNPMFSSRQAFIGTFLGGPLAGTYFLRANFLAKGDTAHARAATIVGVVASLAILAALPFLPERMPHMILPIAYAFAVRAIVDTMQISKEDRPNKRLHSNGRVAVTALTSLGIFVGAAFAGMLVYMLATGTSGGF
jgi:hypothetical protein